MISSYTKTRMIDALTLVSAGNEWVTAVQSRLAVSKDTAARIVIACTSVPLANEIMAKMITGANLSYYAKRECLICLADQRAGNELINAIQSVPLTYVFKL